MYFQPVVVFFHTAGFNSLDRNAVGKTSFKDELVIGRKVEQHIEKDKEPCYDQAHVSSGRYFVRRKVATIGNTVTTIKTADYEAIRKATAGIEAEWIKQVSGRGVDGAKLASEARQTGLKHLKAN